MAKDETYREKELYQKGSGMLGALAEKRQKILEGKTTEITQTVRKVANTGGKLVGPHLGKYDYGDRRKGE